MFINFLLTLYLIVLHCDCFYIGDHKVIYFTFLRHQCHVVLISAIFFFQLSFFSVRSDDKAGKEAQVCM